MLTTALRLKSRPTLPTTLATVEIRPADMFRVSIHQTGEPYFGRQQGNRFDDPEPNTAARYGTSYFGENLTVAVAETLLHDRVSQHGIFFIERTVIAARYCLTFKGSDLILADLTGAELKRMGGHAGLSGTSHYKTPQNWSAAIHRHPDMVDGFRYVSRHINTGMCYLIFDRAADKFTLGHATPLAKHPDFGQVASCLHINEAVPPTRRRKF